MICLLIIKIAHTKANCDCDILQIYDPNHPSNYYNFTKEIEGGWTVYSSNQPHHFWWSKEEKKWIWNFFALSNKISKISGCLGELDDHSYLNWQVQNSSAISEDGKWKYLLNNQSIPVETKCLVSESKGVWREVTS